MKAAMRAMILAAGRGERMRPLTDVTPKPLLKVRGKTLLQWHIEALVQAGISDITINIAHLGEQIRDFAGDGQRFGAKIRYSQEPQGALETAGGIATAQPWRDHQGGLHDSPFLAINADIWTDWPRQQAFAISERLAQSKGRLRCHLVLVDNPPQHPQGDFCLGAPEQGLALVLPRGAGPSLTFSGIGVYDPHMFDGLASGVRAPLAPLLHQAIADACCSGEHHRGIWSDVGTPERLQSLNS